VALLSKIMEFRSIVFLLSGHCLFVCIAAFSVRGSFAISSAPPSAGTCEQGSQWYGSDCWCSPGYYSADGLAPCYPCDNSFNTAAGSTTCLCSPGYASPTGNGPCTECEDLSDTVDWESISYSGPYPYGEFRYVAAPGSSQCYCLPGAKGEAGSSPCQRCPVNSSTFVGFSNVGQVAFPGGRRCYCKPGYWSRNGEEPSESEPCQPCEAYSYALPGSVSCDLCATNAYRVAQNAPCLPCPEGSVNTSPYEYYTFGLSSCSTCDVGYYSPTGNSPCTKCHVNYTTTGIGQSTCWPWAAIHSSSPSMKPTSAPTGPSARPSPSPTFRPSASPTAKPSAQPSCAPTFLPSLFPTAKPSAPPSCPPTYLPSPSPTTSPTSRPTVPHPTATPTPQPTLPDYCQPGFYSDTGVGPHCARCPKGSTNADYGNTRCYCTDRYYSKTGSAPCSRCDKGKSSSALWSHKYCVHCQGYSPGCVKPDDKVNGHNHLRHLRDEEADAEMEEN
jgi:hypothetical protein